jgi:ribosome-associated protein
VAQDDDEEDTPRTLRRRQVRAAGDESARLASALMKASPASLAALGLDDDLREAVDRARRVTAHIARRRAERALAGELRRSTDLDEIGRRLANAQRSGAAEPRLLHLTERWRERLIEEGVSGAAGLPGGAAEPLPRLIQAARSERSTGKPPGAARALFRHILQLLKAQAPSDPDSDS